MNLITLNKEYSLLLKDTVTEYLNPNYIYLPVNDDKLLINPKDYIYKGKEILKNKYSPISGRIVGLKNLTDDKFLVVENDFKEKLENKVSLRKNVNKMSKDQLLELVKNFDLKLYEKLNCNFSKIIINCIEEQLYVGNYMFLVKEYSNELLEILNNISNILELKKITIIVKDTDYNIIDYLNNIVGIYPNINIKFLPNKYLISEKSILCKYLNINEHFIYLNIMELYNLYNFLKRKRIVENKFLTITGNAIENPQVFKCKMYTKLDDIITNFIKFKSENYVIIVNNLLSNHFCDAKELIVTEDIDSIFIMKKREYKEKKCILCGKCNDICPVKIKVSNLINGKNCDYEDCIKCGLCNYICPSYININKYLEGGKNE